MSSSRFKEFRENMKVFVFYVNKYRRYYLFGVVALMIVDGLEVLPPLLLKKLIDNFSLDTHQLRAMVTQIVVALLAIAVVQSWMRYLWRKFIVRTSMFASNDMRNELFTHLSMMSPGFFKKRRVGDLVSLSTNDIETVRFALGPGALTLVDALFYFLLIPPIMLSISPKLTLISFLPMLAVPFVVRRMESIIQKHFKVVQERFSALASHCQESLGGIRVIKGAALEPFKEKELSELGELYIKANLDSAISQSSFSALLDFCVSFATTLLFLMGGAYVLKEKISIGVFVAFQRYIQKMTWPMEAFGLAANIFQRGIASQKRIDDVQLTTAGILPPKNSTEQSEIRVHERQVPLVEVRKLSLTYPGMLHPALQDISFTLTPGMKLGLAGTVGSGKSTLLSCLARMEPIASGQIFFDGIDVMNLPVDYVRRKIGIVPQEVFLFSRTITDNILYGSQHFEHSSPETKLNAARRAAKISCIEKEIDAIADRFDTRLGERGVNLSGGQKQRVSIARAVAREPEILLLDDCLSAVDAETEKSLIHSLQNTAKDMSLVIASHRLSSFEQLDWILVLENGRVVEQGTPKDLQGRRSVFADMHKRQELKEKLQEVELL